MIELLNMDCMDYMKQCSDKQFDLAIVDPPYGIGEDGGKLRANKKSPNYEHQKKNSKYVKKHWDKSGR